MHSISSSWKTTRSKKRLRWFLHKWRYTNHKNIFYYYSAFVSIFNIARKNQRAMAPFCDPCSPCWGNCGLRFNLPTTTTRKTTHNQPCPETWPHHNYKPDHKLSTTFPYTIGVVDLPSTLGILRLPQINLFKCSGDFL